MSTVVITGADRGIGYCLAAEYLKAGYKVYAGQYMEDWPWLAELKRRFRDQLAIIPLDVSKKASIEEAYRLVASREEAVDQLINVAGIPGKGSFEESLHPVLMTNSVGPLIMTETFLPLLMKGKKRLCFFSSEAGVNTLAHRTDGFAYCISKTALNMAAKLMFNRLRPLGYTFRLYHPGWVRSYMSGSKAEVGVFEPEESAKEAFRQFNEERACEDVLLMTDIRGEAWPF